MIITRVQKQSNEKISFQQTVKLATSLQNSLWNLSAICVIYKNLNYESMLCYEQRASSLIPSTLSKRHRCRRQHRFYPPALTSWWPLLRIGVHRLFTWSDGQVVGKWCVIWGSFTLQISKDILTGKMKISWDGWWLTLYFICTLKQHTYQMKVKKKNYKRFDLLYSF